jgi:hypothetical protein
VETWPECPAGPPGEVTGRTAGGPRPTVRGAVTGGGSNDGRPAVATSSIAWTFDADLAGEPFHLEGIASVMLADRPESWVALIDDFYGQG